MNGKFKIVLTVVLLWLAILSCNQIPGDQNQANPEDRTVSNILKYTSTGIEKAGTVPELGLNVSKFLALADSLLTSIQGKSINLSYKIDTITADKISKRSFFQPLLSSDNTIIKRYLFDPGTGNSELSFWIVDATYTDTILTNKVFAQFGKQSGKVNGADDFFPGLTYQNDYVIKTGKKIYWLNSGCSFAFFNHQKIKQLLLQSLKIENAKDSIICKCGQPVCRL
jgi:hypothetical protein